MIFEQMSEGRERESMWRYGEKSLGKMNGRCKGPVAEDSLTLSWSGQVVSVAKRNEMQERSKSAAKVSLCSEGESTGGPMMGTVGSPSTTLTRVEERQHKRMHELRALLPSRRPRGQDQGRNWGEVSVRSWIFFKGTANRIYLQAECGCERVRKVKADSWLLD